MPRVADILDADLRDGLAAAERALCEQIETAQDALQAALLQVPDAAQQVAAFVQAAEPDGTAAPWPRSSCRR